MTSAMSISATSGRFQNLGDLLKSYEHVLVPEMNTGQLKTLLRDQYLVDARSLTKVSGQPFRIAEIEAAIAQHIGADFDQEVPSDDSQLPSPEAVNP